MLFRTFTPLCSCESFPALPCLAFPLPVELSILPTVRNINIHVPQLGSLSCLTGRAGRLVFMTYNGWIMISVSVGAFVGYLLFGDSTSATKENACH